MKTIINTLVVAILLSFGFCGAVSASEPTPAEIQKAKESVAAMEAAIKKAEAEVAQKAAAAEAARRAGRTYGQFFTENVTSAVQTTKATVCATGAGLSTLDGYGGACVAVPARWLTDAAFNGGASAWAAAESAWAAPIAAPAAK